MNHDRPPDWLRALGERLESMPSWARPPFYGMLTVYALMAAKARYVAPLLLVALLFAGPEALLEVLWVLLVAGGAGFAGGLAFALVRPVGQRLGTPGAFLTGWAAVFVYLAVVWSGIGSNDPNSRSRSDWQDPTQWIGVGVMTLIFGSVVAAFLVDTDWPRRRARRTSRAASEAPNPSHG